MYINCHKHQNNCLTLGYKLSYILKYDVYAFVVADDYLYDDVKVCSKLD